MWYYSSFSLKFLIFWMVHYDSSLSKIVKNNPKYVIGLLFSHVNIIYFQSTSISIFFCFAWILFYLSHYISAFWFLFIHTDWLKNYFSSLLQDSNISYFVKFILHFIFIYSFSPKLQRRSFEHGALDLELWTYLTVIYLWTLW